MSSWAGKPFTTRTVTEAGWDAPSWALILGKNDRIAGPAAGRDRVNGYDGKRGVTGSCLSHRPLQRPVSAMRSVHSHNDSSHGLLLQLWAISAGNRKIPYFQGRADGMSLPRGIWAVAMDLGPRSGHFRHPGPAPGRARAGSAAPGTAAGRHQGSEMARMSFSAQSEAGGACGRDHPPSGPVNPPVQLVQRHRGGC
jgi:hypothetical protein